MAGFSIMPCERFSQQWTAAVMPHAYAACHVPCCMP